MLCPMKLRRCVGIFCPAKTMCGLFVFCPVVNKSSDTLCFTIPKKCTVRACQVTDQTRALQGTMEKIEIFGEFEMKMSQHEF